VTPETIPVTIGPNNDTSCAVSADLYVPADPSTLPAPAILTTNGFGGSKADQADAAKNFAARGYVVLSYSGLGFGGSGCNIELDDPDWDGKAASQLITWLAARAEVRKDGPGDPRVGMIGGSYGGAVQLSTASIDSRLDTIIPFITWHDLSYSLAPNNTAAPAAAAAAPGVPKSQWTELFFADGMSQPVQHWGTTPVPPSSCPGFDPRVCTANADTAARGYPSDSTVALLRHASTVSFASKVRVPTMVIQGQADTLFNVNEGVANYQAVKANGVPAKLVLQSWGHSNSTPAPGEFDEANFDKSYESALVLNWFDKYLKGKAVDTGPAVEFFRDWVHYSTPTAAPAYGKADAWPVGTPATLYLSGSSDLVPDAGVVKPGTAQFVNPPGGQPASYSETSAVQSSAPFASIPPTDPPGTFASFTTPPLPTAVESVGIPHVTLRLASAVPQPVLFAKVYDVAADGTKTLVHRLVAPARVADLSKPVTIDLPGVVHRYDAGHKVQLVLAATDQASTGARLPNVLTVSTDASSPSTFTLPVLRATSFESPGAAAAAAAAGGGSQVLGASVSRGAPLPATGGTSPGWLGGLGGLLAAAALGVRRLQNR
jgi:ABC-2 type transport system ATP-binding protein